MKYVQYNNEKYLPYINEIVINYRISHTRKVKKLTEKYTERGD